jgi:H+-translocating NAD(P) transhydrogenase subunit alpha
MAMIIVVPKETSPNERRVALTPLAAAKLIKRGHEVRIQAGAGEAAGYPDDQYREKNVAIVQDRAELIRGGNVVLQVRTPGANPQQGSQDLEHLREGQILIGLAEPLLAAEQAKQLAERGVTLFALELIPRITKAQAMDVLSSQANLAGYKAVITAAQTLGKIFPLMMTAAGTLRPARVFVVGAGVAGLQAIATAKRLGALVQAFDVRPVVKEQVESLGARFVQIEVAAAEGTGGYAKEQSEEQIRRQQELMSRVVAESDVVITTALIPGRPAPKLVTRAMVEQMPPGSVIVDLAAERGGNCELTQPGETITHGGVMIVGDDNLVSAVAQHASAMYANNIVAFLEHLLGKKQSIELDRADAITAGTLVCTGGEIVHPQLREKLGLAPLEAPREGIVAS